MRTNRALIVLILAALFLPSCKSDVAAGQAEARSDAAKAYADAHPADTAAVAAALKAKTDADAANATRDAQTNSVKAGVGTGTLFIPPPYDVLAGMLGTAALGVIATLREKKKTKAKTEEAAKIQTAATEIATSIETAKIAGGGIVNFNDEKTSAMINAAQGDHAKAIVDSVQ